ncbi:male sterility domain-containing protein, putative [Pediculus humanus corporis]|uniref:Fatty acyl-CoA reductase n=1 Tax=Pediculus humanus subsp. corporis TaxID=121224 RepID=E0VLJ7_PEDHC|nr:male sterility domain-containing protein, putative [Pediculus humanus corporis]EEB14253.1 male sterility domain-containing protein, putative [Pediculus humanus corporis]
MATLAQQNFTPNFSPVADFYHDRSVFVTGGTGFMGKVLVEKLLRSCPGIKKIYLLIRPKRGQDIHARLGEIIDSPLFDKLRKERPAELHKIVPIMGDITEPELGISQSDQNLLIKTVSVVFHSAATVKFDEALKLSVTINMLGTKRLVELCHRMLGLEALIHVSTAYCNCDRGEVREIIYPPPYDPEKVIECVEWMNEDLVDVITPKLIGKRPNTYTFTKALAENMLMKESGNLPVAIVRPTIVLSSWNEPVSGWVDNWNGPTGLVAACGKGLFRAMLCEVNSVADLVPVDVVINLMIVAAWKTATSKSIEVSVYNCCTGMQKPITWGSFIYQCIHNLQKNPLSGAFWYPGGDCFSNRLMHKLVVLSSHAFPAYFLDTFYRLVGKKPIMVKMYQKLEKARQCLEYFGNQEWRFRDDNVQELNSILSPEDRKTFPFDVSQIDWPKYLQDYVLGIRRFIFKENPSSIPTARKSIQKLYWIHRLVQICSLMFVLRGVIMRSSQARRLCLFVIDVFLRVYRMIPKF